MKLTNQDAVAATDLDFAAMAVEIGQHAWTLPHLTMREKAFAFIAADMCTHGLGFPLRTHVQMALSQGVGLAALREAVRHLAPYVGYPTAAEALTVLNEIQTPTSEQPLPVNRETLHLDPAVRTEITRLDPAFGDFFADQFEKRYNRGELTVGERALATIAADVVNGTLAGSLRLHVRLALDNGVRQEQVRAVVLLVAEFGMAKAWEAFRPLDGLLQSSS